MVGRSFTRARANRFVAMVWPEAVFHADARRPVIGDEVVTLRKGEYQRPVQALGSTASPARSAADKRAAGNEPGSREPIRPMR